jgi:hypothetical protein
VAALFMRDFCLKKMNALQLNYRIYDTVEFEALKKAIVEGKAE